jgi:O-acetyl-ADP-ribose deacetylase (regulator of RNase III)
MGAGVALAIRKKWPGVFDSYQNAHKSSGLRPGDVVTVASTRASLPPEVLRHTHGLSPDLPAGLIVVNAMTQEKVATRPGQVCVDYDAVEAAFKRVYLLARDSGLPVHFPAIGSGLAGGHWPEVAKRIELVLGPNIVKTLWVPPTSCVVEHLGTKTK